MLSFPLQKNLKDLSSTHGIPYAMMPEFRSVLIRGIFVLLFLLCAGCTQNTVSGPAPAAAETAGAATVPPETIADLQNPTKEDLIAFVQEAVAYARANGKEKTLAEFSSRNGSFFRGVLYIYAYDYNGTTIAHPVNPEKIGVNRLREPDAEGTLFITNLRQAAYNGTGFTTYAYINPAHNNTVEKKLGYAVKVDESWWLGSGIYIGPANTSATATTPQPVL